MDYQKLNCYIVHPLPNNPHNKAARYSEDEPLHAYGVRPDAYTNLRSTDVERYTPKFLKNWETQLFQKLAGVGSRRLILFFDSDAINDLADALVRCILRCRFLQQQ